MLYSKHRKNLGGGRRKRSTRKSSRKNRSNTLRIQGGAVELPIPVPVVPELACESNNKYDTWNETDFTILLATMNKEAKTDVSYDIMNRYVRLYKAHQRESQSRISSGKNHITEEMLTIKKRMKYLLEKHPGLVALWSLPRESNYFISYGPSIHAIMNDDNYNTTYTQ